MIYYIHFVLFHSDQIRGKKKKATGSTKNKPISSRPKHRGWKVNDGCYVSENTILATQRNLRFHPGLNVSDSYNGYSTKFLICFFRIYLGWFR